MSSYGFIRSTNIAANPTTVSDKFIMVQNEEGKYAYKNSDYSANDDKQVISLVSPATAVPASLGGSQVDFKIEPGAIDILSYPVLQAIFLNNTGATGSRTSLHLEVQRLEVLAGDGSKLWTTIDQDLFLSNVFLDRVTFEACVGDMGLTTSYAQAGDLIANGDTYELLMPIYGFFKSCKIAICAIKQPIILRFTFNPSSYTVITGTQMTCQNLNLILYGKNLKTAARNAVKKIYNDPRIPVVLSHLSVDRKTETMALVGGQTYTIVLAGCSGVCSSILLTIRLASTANVPAGETNYNYVETLEVTDNGGMSLIGSYARSPKVRHLLQANMLGNNSSLLRHDFVHFSTDPVASFSRGVVGGYAVITGTEKITFKTTTTLSSASYIVDIKCYMYENLVAFNGSLKSTRT